MVNPTGVRKVIFRNGQSPGDGVMLAHAVESLHLTHPGKFITDMRCPYPELFEGSPHIKPLDENEPGVELYDMGYDTIHRSNQYPFHFVTGFMYDMATALRVYIDPAPWSGFIHIREEEKCWFSAVYEIIGADVPYWVVNAGYKMDYTAKQWAFERYQAVVDANPDVVFVQVGAAHPHHVHPELKGNNLINMVGKTDLRQLVRLIYNSFGVLTPCSMAMVLAYGIPAHPRFGRQARACVVLGGGREPNHWQQGPNQQYIHTCGMLDCCQMGGCWKSRVCPLGDGDRKDQDLCHKPVELPNGQVIAKCMDMITADYVNGLIRAYVDNLNYHVVTQPHPTDVVEPFPQKQVQPEAPEMPAHVRGAPPRKPYAPDAPTQGVQAIQMAQAIPVKQTLVRPGTPTQGPLVPFSPPPGAPLHPIAPKRATRPILHPVSQSQPVEGEYVETDSESIEFKTPTDQPPAEGGL